MHTEFNAIMLTYWEINLAHRGAINYDDQEIAERLASAKSRYELEYLAGVGIAAASESTTVFDWDRIDEISNSDVPLVPVAFDPKKEALLLDILFFYKLAGDDRRKQLDGMESADSRRRDRAAFSARSVLRNPGNPVHLRLLK